MEPFFYLRRSRASMEQAACGMTPHLARVFYPARIIQPCVELSPTLEVCVPEGKICSHRCLTVWLQKRTYMSAYFFFFMAFFFIALFFFMLFFIDFPILLCEFL